MKQLYPKGVAAAPEITIDAAALQRIEHWVKICPDEISGFGLVEEVEGGYFISEVFLLEQKVSGSETELDEMAIAALQYELSQREEGLQDKLRFWWHSHVNMNVFWSATDEEAITQLLGKNALVSIVFNKRKEYRARVDLGTGHFRVKWDDLPMNVRNSLSGRDIANMIFKDALEIAGGEEGKAVKALDLLAAGVSALVRRGIISDDWTHVDLGLEEECKKEFEEKVTRMIACFPNWNSKSKSNNTKNITQYNKYPKSKAGVMQYYKGNVDPYLDDEIFDFKKFSNEASALDVYEFMQSNRWGK